MDFYRRKLLERSLFILLLILGVVGIFTLQRSRLRPLQNQLATAQYQHQSQQEKLKLSLLQNIPSFGFSNLVADWTYLGFIQYFGDTLARDAIGYELIPEYFRQTVHRDPRFADAMIALSSANTLFAGEPQKSVQYLDQSLQHITPTQTVFANQLYFLWVYKGRDQFLFLGDAQGAIKSYTMAIDWAKLLGTERGLKTSKTLSASIKFLRKNPKSKVARIGAWSLVLSTSFDPRTQQRVIAEINALGGIVLQTPDGRLRVKVPDGVE
jgi:hypothetical protein